MGRFNFVSPGAGITESITKLLAERKAEERQNLLDRLAVTADQRAQEQVEEQKRMNDARMASQQQQDEISMWNAVAPNLDMGATVDDPNLIELGKKFGGLRYAPGPQVSSNVNFMTTDGQPLDGGEAPSGLDIANADLMNKPKYRWEAVGNPDERAKRRRDDRAGAYIASLVGKPETQPQGEFLGGMSAMTDGNIPERSLQEALIPRSTRVFNQSTGKFSDTTQPIGFGEEITNWTRPPRELQPKSWFNTGAVDENGAPIIMDQDSGQQVKLPPNARKGADPNEGVLGIKQGTKEMHSYQIGALGENPNNVSDDRLLMFRQSAGNMVEEAKTTPKVKELAAIFILDIPKFETALRDAVMKNELDERERSHIRQLTNAIANPQAQQILRNYPFRPKKQAPKSGASAAPTRGLEQTLAGRQIWGGGSR